jgi:hypothetical protein
MCSVFWIHIHYWWGCVIEVQIVYFGDQTSVGVEYDENGDWHFRPIWYAYIWFCSKIYKVIDYKSL